MFLFEWSDMDGVIPLIRVYPFPTHCPSRCGAIDNCNIPIPVRIRVIHSRLSRPLLFNYTLCIGTMSNIVYLRASHINNFRAVYIHAGGWTLSDHFPTLSANPIARNTFAQKCVEILTYHDFDGIDIDWEVSLFGCKNSSIRCL